VDDDGAVGRFYFRQPVIESGILVAGGPEYDQLFVRVGVGMRKGSLDRDDVTPGRIDIEFITASRLGDRYEQETDPCQHMGAANRLFKKEVHEE